MDNPASGKMYQISESDLVELERMLPRIFERVCHHPDSVPRDRIATRVIKRILSDVRWNYGPHEETEIFPCE